MNKGYAFGLVFLVIAYLLSACGAEALPITGKQEQVDVQAQFQDSTFEVAYTGVIEAINGNQWKINGVELTIDSSVIQGGSFIVGDTVKIEGNLGSDGSIIVSQVSSPSASDLTNLSELGSSVDAATDNDNSNENINSNDNANSNENINDNANTDNTNNNTNTDDNDGNTNNNTNSDDDDGNTNNNTNNDDDDDDDNTNNNTADDEVDSGNINGG